MGAVGGVALAVNRVALVLVVLAHHNEADMVASGSGEVFAVHIGVLSAGGIAVSVAEAFQHHVGSRQLVGASASVIFVVIV